MHFRKAEPTDADVFPDIEQSAGLSFRADRELAWLTDADNLSAEGYREIIGKGWSWLAENELAHPIAFVAASLENAELHIWEFAVRIECQRRGIGRRFLQRFVAEAAAARIAAITLTTFRDVPWNAPFYGAMGFDVVEKLDPRLAGLLEAEVRKGLPAARRCAMRKRMLP
jgi:GNAT superfamily N-acetyltransferase